MSQKCKDPGVHFNLRKVRGQNKLSCCCLAPRSLRGRPLGNGGAPAERVGELALEACVAERPPTIGRRARRVHETWHSRCMPENLL